MGILLNFFSYHKHDIKINGWRKRRTAAAWRMMMWHFTESVMHFPWVSSKLDSCDGSVGREVSSTVPQSHNHFYDSHMINYTDPSHRPNWVNSLKDLDLRYYQPVASIIWFAWLWNNPITSRSRTRRINGHLDRHQLRKCKLNMNWCWMLLPFWLAFFFIPLVFC